MSEWISVKERLPEKENEMVLVTDGLTVITGFRNWMFRLEDGKVYTPVLAPGEIRHSGPGENRQFWPGENRQSLFTN